MTTADQTILQALASDHAGLLDLLGRLRGGATEDLRQELVIETVRHFVAEEQYLYPLVRDRLPDGGALADEGFAANRECERLLRRFEQPGHDEAATLAELRQLLGRHVESQQAELFGRLAGAVPADELRALAAEVRGAEQLAPTRPRVLAASNPALNKFSSLVEGFLDHVRDSYGHRGAHADHVE
ncbi:MAG TPA: hemerythrin domain-containing protein [Jatrophihabitans sp.]|nr:hemerythrin domain-containing protein [Jatrophihabitans sp.]